MPYATVVADGALNECVANEVNVVPNQDFTMSVWIRWTSITYTGTNPIAFGVTEYEKKIDATTGVISFEEGLSKDLGFVAAPSASSSNPANNNFIQYTATPYTVPAAGVDQIRMRLKIGANLTAGTVDWSDAELLPGSFIRDEAAPGIGENKDNITSKLTGIDTVGASNTDSRNALGEQNNTVKGSAMAIASLQAQLTPGVYAQDLFEDPAGAFNSSNWDQNLGSGAGAWELDGHNAFWHAVYPGGPRESLNRWIGPNAVSNTDYQTVVAVLSAAATTDKVGTYSGYTDVIARCDSTEQNYIRFRVGGNGTWTLSKFVAGVETVMASGTATSPGSGSYIGLMCGDKTNLVPRYFAVWIGSTIVTQGVLGDTTSNYGASYRGWGFGGRAEGVLFESTQYTPGSLAAWTGQDTA